MQKITKREFFTTDTITLAKNLIGKWIKTTINGKTQLAQISETEAYLGITDSACHTYLNKRTPRTEPMYNIGGTIYIYLCYGMHLMLNIVSKNKNEPEAVLIRAITGHNGPAKATKFLNIDKSLNNTSILNNKSICILDDQKTYNYTSLPRVGINYATPQDHQAPLRFKLIE